MIYTITLNPSLDYTVHVDSFRSGEINRTTDESISPGGKGINVSIVLSHFGITSTAMGFLAGFTGRQIQRLLDEQNIRTDFIEVEGGLSRINMKLISDEETAVNGMGPVITEKDVEKLYGKLDALQDGDVLVLSGSVPSSLPAAIYRDILERLSARKVDAVVDATKDRLVQVLGCRPFLVKPNHHELGEIFGVKIEGKKEAAHYAEKMIEMGARNVLVSMADQGAVFAGQDGTVLYADSPRGKLVNSVGAGDSMVAGFLAGYRKNHDFREAFEWGVCTGSASAFSSGLATREEAEKLLRENRDCFEGIRA